MARTSLQDIQSTQDPLLAYNFDIILPPLPGGGSNRQLTIRCQSTTIPESQLEQTSVEAHGIKLNFAGRRTWTGTWSATFFETRTNSTRDAIVAWQELARSWIGNAGTYKSVYSIPVEIVLYDDLPQVIRRIKMVGVFPTDTGAPSFDYTATVVTYQVQFSFDYTEDLAP